MPNSETEYIELCKRQLEEKFSFGNGQGYTQKDLEQLSNYIQEKKGVNISLSTLKRVWKNDFKQGPQLATLNSLVSVLSYENWQDFKIQNKKYYSSTIRTVNASSSIFNSARIVGIFVAIIITSIGWVAIQSSKTKKSISFSKPVIFEVDKTLLKGVPNTAIFKYDLSGVEADSFFIQQSWNRWRRKKIDPAGSVHSSIYFESGYHRAKLIANDSVIAVQPVHIISDGWEPHVYYAESDEKFIDFTGESIIYNGALHLPMTLLNKRSVDTSRQFYTRINNSRDFNVSSDNFHFTTRAKVDPYTDSNCPWLICQIVTEKHIYYVKLVGKGCELFGAYKLGEVVRIGENRDLAALGQDVYNWQKVEVFVKDKFATIYLNGELVFTELYQEDFGRIMGLSYVFDGKGSVDFVQLSEINDSVLFEDRFNLTQ